MKLYTRTLIATLTTTLAVAGWAIAQEGEPAPAEPAPVEPAPVEPTPAEVCPVQQSEGNGLFVGIVSDQLFADPDPEYRRCSLNRHADVGVRIIRQALLWKEIERKRGRYDWAHWDQYVGDLARHGIEVMPIIFDAPRWRQRKLPNRNARRDWAAVPPKNGAIARFAARLVRRYGPDGSFWAANPEIEPLPVRVWQIWNEPNLPRYWAPRPNAAEYVAMLQATSRAIKREDPDAEIVTAGMPDSRLRRVIPLYAYITQMYEAGARGAFDALAVNAYSERPRGMIENLEKTRAIMSYFRDRSKMWVTEVGWGTGGPKYRFRVSRSLQASLVGQALRKLRDNRWRLGIKGFIHYMWQDAPPYGDTPDFWGLHTGLHDKQGREKPSYRVFRKLGRQLRWIR
jgi:hypothetical protein